MEADTIQRPYLPSREESARLQKMQADEIQPSRFLRLPGELRNRVYEYLLISSEEDVVTADTQMLRVCKQIYAEGWNFLYGDNTIKIECVY